MTPEERIMRAYRRSARRMAMDAHEHMTERALFEAHGLTPAQATAVLNSVPRRRCPCGNHGDRP